MLRSARTVSAFTLLSRVLGLVRDTATARLLGAGLVNDALVAAWRLPNAFRRLFGEGALSSAFLPVLVRTDQRHGRPAVRALACQVISTLGLGLSALAAALILLSVLLELAVPSLFDGQGELLTLRFSQILLPYMVVICVLAQFMAVLNALGEFRVPALSPALLNLVWVGGVGVAWWLGPHLAAPGDDPRPVQGLIVIGAILLASGVQFAAHLPALRAHGVGFRLARPRWTPELREVLARMGPMLVGMGAAQVNVLADTYIALALLPDGGVSHLYYGMRLMQFPLGLVSVALVTAVFPAVSRLLAEHDHAGAADAGRTALRTNLLLSGVAAAGLLVLASPIVALLFEGGEFGAADTRLTALALRGYALGIPFAGTVMLLTRVSYAAGEVSGPARVGVAMVLVNLVLDVLLVGPLGGFGLALATSVASLGSALVLLIAVARRLDARAVDLLGGWLRPLAVTLLLAGGVAALDAVLAARDAAPWLRTAAGAGAGLLLFVPLARALCPQAWTSLVGLLPGRR